MAPPAAQEAQRRRALAPEAAARGRAAHGSAACEAASPGAAAAIARRCREAGNSGDAAHPAAAAHQTSLGVSPGGAWLPRPLSSLGLMQCTRMLCRTCSETWPGPVTIATMGSTTALANRSGVVPRSAGNAATNLGHGNSVAAAGTHIDGATVGRPPMGHRTAVAAYAEPAAAVAAGANACRAAALHAEDVHAVHNAALAARHAFARVAGNPAKAAHVAHSTAVHVAAAAEVPDDCAGRQGPFGPAGPTGPALASKPFSAPYARSAGWDA
mmetsp:Transcript_76998/g.214059  ORF Transcript_76998/g.214059 Transcript_76998/m.214059 type:complete len:270 (-) Transcript_76998:255-1064(-)